MTAVVNAGFDQLVELPAMMLGFQPEESVVAMLSLGGRVVMCARSDAEADVDDFVDQVTAGAGNVPNEAREPLEWALVGYTAEPAVLAERLEDMRELLGRDRTRDVRVVSGGRFWEVLHGRLVGAGVPVGRGIVSGAGAAASREVVVAEVRPVAPSEELLELWGSWWTWESFEAGSERLLALLEGPDELDMAGAVEVAELLSGVERVGLVLQRLNAGTASVLRPRLAAARRFGEPSTSVGDVLGLLGLACWLDREGAQLSEVLVQLGEAAPTHPFRSVLESLHNVPPSVAGF